jgi:hypothetical protein
MGNGASRTKRLPRDVRVRERMRAAQQQEGAALAGVCVAMEQLRRASARRDTVVAAATAVVDRAQAAVEAAHAEVVRISGIERAALILAMDVAELRKSGGAKKGGR